MSVVSSVVLVGVGRRNRECGEQSGKQQNHDFSHRFSSKFLLVDLSREFNFVFLLQSLNASPIGPVCSQLLAAGDLDRRFGSCSLSDV